MTISEGLIYQIIKDEYDIHNFHIVRYNKCSTEIVVKIFQCSQDGAGERLVHIDNHKYNKWLRNYKINSVISK